MINLKHFPSHNEVLDKTWTNNLQFIISESVYKDKHELKMLVS